MQQSFQLPFDFQAVCVEIVVSGQHFPLGHRIGENGHGSCPLHPFEHMRLQFRQIFRSVDIAQAVGNPGNREFFK